MDKYKELTFVICIIIEAIKFCCTYIYLFKNSTLRNSTDFTMFNCQNKICDGSKINFKGVFNIILIISPAKNMRNLKMDRM